jgi:hypothetical protein
MTNPIVYDNDIGPEDPTTIIDTNGFNEDTQAMQPIDDVVKEKAGSNGDSLDMTAAQIDFIERQKRYGLPVVKNGNNGTSTPEYNAEEGFTPNNKPMIERREPKQDSSIYFG